MAAKKEYILKIIWSADKDELNHLSEEFSDIETYKLEVNGKLMDAPKGMRKYLDKYDLTLGLA